MTDIIEVGDNEITLNEDQLWRIKTNFKFLIRYYQFHKYDGSTTTFLDHIRNFKNLMHPEILIYKMSAPIECLPCFTENKIGHFDLTYFIKYLYKGQKITGQLTVGLNFSEIPEI